MDLGDLLIGVAAADQTDGKERPVAPRQTAGTGFIGIFGRMGILAPDTPPAVGIKAGIFVAAQTESFRRVVGRKAAVSTDTDVINTDDLDNVVDMVKHSIEVILTMELNGLLVNISMILMNFLV